MPKKSPNTNEPLPEYSTENSQTTIPTDTRSSGYSSFDLIDGNLTSTPFENTPSASPLKTSSLLPGNKPPTPQPELELSDEIMSSEQVAPFYGDKEDENPEDFLRAFFRRMGTANDDVKKLQFPNFLQADSIADEWYEDLAPLDKKDWNAIVTSFRKRWPRKKAVKKTIEEYEEEITGLHLKMEDMGKKDKIAGRDVYSHIAWADKMAAVVKGAKLEDTTTYIGHVRKALPKLLREKVGAGHADWVEFLQAVRDIDVDYIRDGAEAWRKDQQEQETLKKRIQQLEKLTASPTAPLRQQMTMFGVGDPLSNPTRSPAPQQAPAAPSNPFASSGGGRGNLFYTSQTRPQHSSNPRPPPTQADRDALLNRLQKYPHHPDTEAGRQAHRAQQAEWAKTHGFNAFVTESTPYPLRPGTSPVCSGECFTCGLPGHMGRRDGSTCGGNRPLHQHEQTWRAICSRILRQPRAAANIQLVAVDDYGTTWNEVQGKEEGPST